MNKNRPASMKAKEILQKAKELLETKGWNQMVYARNHFGDSVHASSKNAVSFCMLGALINVSTDDNEILQRNYELNFATEILKKANKIDLIGNFNDKPGRSKEEVLKAFDNAIERLEFIDQMLGSENDNA